MLRSAEGTVLAIIHFNKRGVLVWILSGRASATTTQHYPKHTFPLREDKCQEQNLYRSWELEPVELSIIKTEQKICEQPFIPHTTLQDNGRFVVRLPRKMDPKQLRTSHLAAERRLRAFERRLDQNLMDKYNYFMSTSKGLDRSFPVNSQEGKEYATV